MDPIVIAALIWMIAAPVFLVLWLLGRRKLNKLIADTQRDADLNRAALTKGEAEHNATKAKYSSIISQEAEVARLQAIAATLSTLSLARLQAGDAAGAVECELEALGLFCREAGVV